MGLLFSVKYKQWSIQKVQHQRTDLCTPIYLTIAERDRLYAADIPEEHDLRTLRDIFILQCNIGCRIGDLYSFTTDNLIESDKGTAIQYIPGKTKDEKPRVVKVYLTKTALEILERNKGRRLNYLMPYYDKNKPPSLMSFH